MKPLNYLAVLDGMTESEWDYLHETVLEASGKPLPQRDLEKVLERLYPEIWADALQWGFGDRVVADETYACVEEAVERFVSIEAWLKAQP